jgi:hypothetical protein
MAYFDSLGNNTATPANVARVQIFMSGKTGIANEPLGLDEALDSLSFAIGLRNRS